MQVDSNMPIPPMDPDDEKRLMEALDDFIEEVSDPVPGFPNLRQIRMDSLFGFGGNAKVQ
jgi:hypothetical protein